MDTLTIPFGKSVLVVEDNEERINLFRMKLERQCNLTVARTPQKALNVLGAHRFDLIFLDHDSINRFVNEYEPDYDSFSFWKVAELLARTKYDGLVVIHSHNPVGAVRMQKLLFENGVRSHAMKFGFFKIEIKHDAASPHF